MGNDLDCTEKKEIDTFFRNNYDQVLKTSRSIKEFAENYQDKTIKGIKYCTTQRNDYPSYYNQKLLHYTKNFDKDNKEREMKESAEREEMLRSEVSYLRSSVNSYSSRLQQIENQKMVKGISLNTLYTIAQVYNFDIRDFFGGYEELMKNEKVRK